LRMNRVSVVGTGAWGTALAIQARRAGCEVELVARDAASAARLSATRSSARLAEVTIPRDIRIAAAIGDGADILIWAVPTQQLRASLQHYRPEAGALVICAKGVEASTGRLPTEVVTEVLGPWPMAVLSGPNFAGEIARGLPAASVIACTDAILRERMRASLGTAEFRLYGNGDPTGVQLCGAAKNVVAIASGAVIGAGLGENARASLVTRGLSELRRLIVAEGGLAETVMGLAGLGDLMLTCAGPTSRNFRFGLSLGAGAAGHVTVPDPAETVEGRATARALVDRASRMDLPICRAVADLLDGVKTLDEIVRGLLSRPWRDE
jgi:glycerol-3-phosphate dehydrogenase (NAD(P)+)